MNPDDKDELLLMAKSFEGFVASLLDKGITLKDLMTYTFMSSALTIYGNVGEEGVIDMLSLIMNIHKYQEGIPIKIIKEKLNL